VDNQNVLSCCACSASRGDDRSCFVFRLSPYTDVYPLSGIPDHLSVRSPFSATSAPRREISGRVLQKDRACVVSWRGEVKPAILVEFGNRYPALSTIYLPYSEFMPWLLEHGLDFRLFVRELFANRIRAFFAMDVILCAIVLICFIQSEGKRLSVRLLWLPTIGMLLVGVSFGFPLFLFLRQAMLDREKICGTNDGQ
jgi:hypothetical protein